MKTIVLLLLGLCQGFSSTYASDMKTVTVADKVVLQVPASIEVTRRTPMMPDFDLVEFKRNGALLMDVYLGNAPDFPGPDCESKISKTTVSGFSAKVVLGKAGSSCFKEILLDFGSGIEWPRFAHFRLERITNAQETEEIEAIVRSVRLNK